MTPYELEIALQAEQSWTGRYVLSFEQLLAESKQKPDHGTLHEPSIFRLNTKSFYPDGDATQQEDQEEADPDQPTFSLVTGKYRHAKRYGGQSRPR